MLVVCMLSEMQVHLVQVVQLACFWDRPWMIVAVQKEYARVVVVLTRRSLVCGAPWISGTINIRVPIIILA